MNTCACGCGAAVPVRKNGKPYRFARFHNSRINRRGYVRIRMGGQSVQQHVVVATRALGRPIPVGAEVHHVDGDKRNNAPANLVICQDMAYHQLLHRRARVVRAGGDPGRHLVCGRCGEVKAFSEFNRRKHGLEWRYQSNCRECMRARWAERQARKGAA